MQTASESTRTRPRLAPASAYGSRFIEVLRSSCHNMLMKIEHVAFNHSDPNAVSRWYVEHLGFTVKKRLVEEPFTHFLADDSGTVMLEIYRQNAPVPEYATTNVMSLHLALVSADVEADTKRLVEAGGTLDGEIQNFDNGDCFAMVRDPWGFTLQLVSRGEPMI